MILLKFTLLLFFKQPVLISWMLATSYFLEKAFVIIYIYIYIIFFLLLESSVSSKFFFNSLVVLVFDSM